MSFVSPGEGLGGVPSAAEAAGAARVDWDAAERVELSIPAEPELRVLARLTASTVAARLDYGFDEIEDLRLAIDELCISCAAGAGAESRLRLCFETAAESIRVECVAEKVVEPADEGDLAGGGMSSVELSRRIIEELVDEYAIGAVIGGQRRGYLEKRRSVTPR